MEETTRLESGVEYRLIYSYLAEELALAQTGAGDFCFGACQIRLRPLPPRQLGSFTLPNNELLLSGDKGDMEAFIGRFVRRFLSAGG